MFFRIYFVIGTPSIVSPPGEPAAFMLDQDDPVSIGMIRRTPKGHFAGAGDLRDRTPLQLTTGAGIVPLDCVSTGWHFQVRRSTLREVNRVSVARLGETPAPGYQAVGRRHVDKWQVIAKEIQGMACLVP